MHQRGTDAMHAQPLKVLFLPKWYPNTLDPLDGIFTVDHALAAARNHRIFVLFVHSDAGLTERVKTLLDGTKGITEMTVYFRPRKTGIRMADQLISGLTYLAVQFRAYRELKKTYGAPDIVHVHVLLRSALLASWLKFRRGIPYIITEHWSGYDPKSGYSIGQFKKLAISYLLKRAATVTAVSGYLKAHLQQINSSARYTVISNAIDETLFQPAKNKIPHNKKQLIHVSTLDDYPKNTGAILRVMARVYNDFPDVELHLIGTGVELEKQQALAERLHVLGKAVFFHGYLPKKEVAARIAQSDCMLLFSHYETQSCVLLEAFMCGVPVIAPAIGGVSEIVEPHNGVLVPHLDEEQFYRAILSFLRGELTFDQSIIREKAMRYGYEQVGNAFGRLYEQVVHSQYWKSQEY